MTWQKIIPDNYFISLRQDVARYYTEVISPIALIQFQPATLIGCLCCCRHDPSLPLGLLRHQNRWNINGPACAPQSRDAPWYFWKLSSILWAMMTIVARERGGQVGVGSLGWKGHQVARSWTAPSDGCRATESGQTLLSPEVKWSRLSRPFEAGSRCLFLLNERHDSHSSRAKKRTL